MRLRPFVDPLPIPRVLQPLERRKDKTYYEVRMKEFFHQFHSQLPLPGSGVMRVSSPAPP